WLQTIERAQDTDFRDNMNFVILMRDTKFHNFIILTIIMLASHDSVAETGSSFLNEILRPIGSRRISGLVTFGELCRLNLGDHVNFDASAEWHLCHTDGAA